MLTAAWNGSPRTRNTTDAAAADGTVSAVAATANSNMKRSRRTVSVSWSSAGVVVERSPQAAGFGPDGASPQKHVRSSSRTLNSLPPPQLYGGAETKTADGNNPISAGGGHHRRKSSTASQKRPKRRIAPKNPAHFTFSPNTSTSEMRESAADEILRRVCIWYLTVCMFVCFVFWW